MDLNFIIFPKPVFTAQPEEFYSNILLVPKQVHPVKTISVARSGMGSNRVAKVSAPPQVGRKEHIAGAIGGYFLPTAGPFMDTENSRLSSQNYGIGKQIGFTKSSSNSQNELKASRKAKTANNSKVPEESVMAYHNTLEFDDEDEHIQPIPLIERLVRIPSRRNDTPSSIQINAAADLAAEKSIKLLDERAIREINFSQNSERHMVTSDSMRRMLQKFNNKPVVVKRSGIPPGPKLTTSSKIAIAVDENTLHFNRRLASHSSNEPRANNKSNSNLSKLVQEMEGLRKQRVDSNTIKAYVDFVRDPPPNMIMTEPAETHKQSRENVQEVSSYLEAPDEYVSIQKSTSAQQEKDVISTVGPIGESNLKTLLNRKSLNELNRMYQSKKSIDLQPKPESIKEGPRLKLSNRLQQATFLTVKPKLAPSGPAFKPISTPNRQLSGERSGSRLASRLLLKGVSESPDHPKIMSTLPQPQATLLGFSPKPLRLITPQANQYLSPSRRVPSRPFLRTPVTSKPSTPVNKQQPAGNSILTELEASQMESPEEKMQMYNHLARLKKQVTASHTKDKEVSPGRTIAPIWRDSDTRKAAVAKMMLQSDTNELDSIPCLLIPPPNVSDTLVLYFHANGEDLVQCQWLCERIASDLKVEIFSPQTFVMAVEYPGYSLYKCQTEISESQLIQDGEVVVHHLLDKYRIKPSRIVMVGRSLGSGIACALASKFKVGALILISPLKSVQEVAKEHYGSLTALLVKDRFNNTKYISKVLCPALIIHGANDKLVPLSHAQELQSRFCLMQLFVPRCASWSVQRV